MLHITGSIRLAKMIDNFWERRYQKKIERLWQEIEDILRDDEFFGNIVKKDETGFLRSFSQAKQVFSSLYPNDPLWGVVIEGQINPKFIAMLNDFYKEIRPNSELQHSDYKKMGNCKKDEYISLRNTLIKKFETNFDAYSEEYARRRFGMSRKSMFARIKINELLWGLSIKDNLWHIFTHSDYKEALSKKELNENIPIFSFDVK